LKTNCPSKSKLKMKQYIYSCFSFLIVLVVACQPIKQKEKLQWQDLGGGITKLTIGTPEKINLTNQLQVQPKWEALQAMPKASLPFDPKELKIELVDNKTYIHFKLNPEEQIYGLGLQFKNVEQRGHHYRLHVDHYGGKDNGRTHAPVPFFISSTGYGAFINSARYIEVYVGTSGDKETASLHEQDRNTNKEWSPKATSTHLDLIVPAKGAEVILFSGQTLLDVVRRYNLYNGGGVLPPKWGLGFWQRVPSLSTAKDVQEEVNAFRKKGFPLSVIGLEPGWMSRSYPCTYEWDPQRFPNPDKFMKEMTQNNIKVNVWMNEGISPRSEIAKALYPLSASRTLWNGYLPDYILPKAQQLVAQHLEKHLLSKGVSGFKMDENDGYDQWIFPDVTHFPSGTPAEQMRQLYGSLMQNFTTQLFRNKNERTYGLVRAGNAGTNAFPYVIYNDYFNHRDFITAQINSSFIGVLWTPEVRASKSPDEWLRRMQTVCFSPLAMLNAWADGTKPWSYKEVENEVREVQLLRMRLLPYLYTTFADYAFYGTPPTRAMNLLPAFNSTLEQDLHRTVDATNNPYAIAQHKEIKDQYMIGDNLLVAPLFAGETERNVILPKGKWYDFYTGKLVGKEEIIIAKPSFKHIPVYVKDGGIIPLLPPLTQTPQGKYPLEIRHYGSKSGSFMLYDDDGHTYNYEKGEYSRLHIEVKVDKKGKKVGKVTFAKGKQSWLYNSIFNFKFMTK